MKTIILLSGGIDSALVTYLAREDGEIELLLIKYGQSLPERLAAAKIAKWYNKKLHMTSITIPLSKVPNKTNFIPARNQILLSIGLAYAIDSGCDHIGIGANKDDYTNYVDCRANWLDQFEQLSNIYYPVKVYSPLLSYTKTDIIHYAIHKGIPLEKTFTCYTPKQNKACGKCNACKLRLQSFKEIGMEDPCQYIK